MKPSVGLVGPCASGKSILKEKLERHGFQVFHIAQDHSCVPDMWEKVANPDVLIYLEVSFETSLSRRKTNMNQDDFAEEIARLRHARAHADFVLNTDPLSPEEVLSAVLNFLTKLFG